MAWSESSKELPLVGVETASVNWDKAIRGFRAEHNFSVGIGSDSSLLGAAKGTGSRITSRSESLRAEVAYSFHLPIFKGFGYYLGSTAGLIREQFNDNQFQGNYNMILPGLDAGLAWNLSNRWRLGLGYTFGWQRVESLKIQDFTDEGAKVSINGESVSYRASIDYFFKLSEAVRIEFEQFTFYFSAPAILDLEKNGRSLKFIFLKHLI